jgi:hypothetical protein
MPNSNLERLIATARLLQPMLHDLVFVGGSMTGLLITDEASGDPRATLDVDAITPVDSYAAYIAIGERLRLLGFAEDTSEDAPLCRWVHREIVLDVMPLNEDILGFSNRWYGAAIVAAVSRQLTDDLEIRTVTAPFFLATKFEAFHGRGKGDYFSHDLEDIIAVVDGRESLFAEVQGESAQLREYIRLQSEHLLATSEFLDALPGLLLPDAMSQARIDIILARLRALAAL